MTKQEELKIVEKMYEGDIDALQKILQEGVRLSVVMASKYASNAEEKVHYSRCAMLGFYKAIYIYRTSEGRGKHKFTTYATYFMKTEIEKEMASL